MSPKLVRPFLIDGVVRGHKCMLCISFYTLPFTLQFVYCYAHRFVLPEGYPVHPRQQSNSGMWKGKERRIIARTPFFAVKLQSLFVIGGLQEILLRMCCAMLVCVRDRLLAGDFATNLKLLQKYPAIDLELIIRTAESFKL